MCGGVPGKGGTTLRWIWDPEREWTSLVEGYTESAMGPQSEWVSREEDYFGREMRPVRDLCAACCEDRNACGIALLQPSKTAEKMDRRTPLLGRCG